VGKRDRQLATSGQHVADGDVNYRPSQEHSGGSLKLFEYYRIFENLVLEQLMKYRKGKWSMFSKGFLDKACVSKETGDGSKECQVAHDKPKPLNVIKEAVRKPEVKPSQGKAQQSDARSSSYANNNAESTALCKAVSRGEHCNKAKTDGQGWKI
jgi:hypothetical protein